MADRNKPEGLRSGAMHRLLVWVQIFGVFGVLAGVVLVILQLQQNEELIRVQIATELRINRDAGRIAIRGENYADVLAKATAGSTELTVAELHQFSAHANSIYEELHLRRMLRDVGVFVGDWKNWLVEETCQTLDNPTGHAWLEWTLANTHANAWIEGSFSGGESDEILVELQRRVDLCGDSFQQFVEHRRQAAASAE